MIKKCTPSFIKELELNAQEGKIEKLIIELKGADYFADYTIVETPMDIDLSNKVRVASILKEFGVMLSVDKVNSFSMYYVPNDDMCVISHSYKMLPEDVNKETKLEKAKNDLVNVMTLLTEIGVAELPLTDVYKRSEKQNVNQNMTNQKQNNGKIRYQEITIEKAINKLLEVIK